MNFGVGISNALTRLNSINEIFGSLPLHALNNPYVLKHMSQTNVNNLKQWIYNQSFIFRALEKSLFGPSGLTKQSGKVHFQKQTGGNPYQTMFQIFFILLALTATLIESSNEMVVNSQKSEPAFEWRTNLVVETKVVNVINVPGTITPMFGALTYKWPLNTAINKLFQETQRDVSKLLKEIRGKCLSHGKQSKAYMHLEYINTDDGSQVIDSITQNPTTYDKDTQMAACFEINPLPFNFNPNTGNIEFIHVNMPLNQVTQILYTIVGDMESVIKATAPNQDKELVEAYNGMLIIANGLEKIGELLFDVFSPVVFNADTIDEYRIESLKESFDAIIKEMSQMKDLLNLKNPIQRIAAEKSLVEANEELENKQIIADARTAMRMAKDIASEQNVQDTKQHYGNKFTEIIAPVSAIGDNILQIPVKMSESVSDAVVKTVLAPINSILHGGEELIMSNKLILLLAAFGVFLSGVAVIKFNSYVVTITYKIGNLIKTIVLSPIKASIYIGKSIYSVGQKIKVLLYRPKDEETTIVPVANPVATTTTTPPLKIDNGSNVPTTTTTIVPVANPVATTTTQVVVKRKPTKEELELLTKKESIKNSLKTQEEHLKKISSNSRSSLNPMQIDTLDKNIKSYKTQIAELQLELDKVETKLHNLTARGTRKRNNKKNTKKNKKRVPVKPSRKFKLRK